ncbi:MAG: exodeoxyribonuclease V subunit gamma [Desulfosarcinaceae bacterium]|nr:exodeoxyribonuclease V subunit gamma [Desulfosarcinaceae bacterium]
MPLELFFSNRLERLAADLAQFLYAGTLSEENPFQAATIVVPNQHLAKWLRLRFARQLGVSMNIHYTYLETALWNALLRLANLPNPPLPIDQDVYTLALLRVLEALPKEDPICAPLFDYLAQDQRQGGEGDSVLINSRHWQLATRLAHLFLEYELNRPEWMPAWRSGRIDGGGMQACQAHLYRETLALCDQLSAALETPLRSLAQLARETLRTANTSAMRPNLPALPELNIFGLSQMSRFHIALIQRLLPHTVIRVFALNPSEAFWEDVRTPREVRWEAAQSGGRSPANSADDASDADPHSDLLAGGDHPLLALWGKPGRDHIRHLCELGDYDFQARFLPADQPGSLLGRLQESLRAADCRTIGAAGLQDTSIQIVGCPGRLREVETIYQRILYQLGQNPDLMQTDIAVLVPDMRVYKPLFEAVFQRHPRQLSYNLVDSRAETESHYGRGVIALMNLLAGRFSRNEVFGMMLNPLFLERWSVTMEMVSTWAGWIDALNVYHSFDLREKTAQGGAPTSRFTWQQGLRRLRLGRIMATEDAAAYQGLLPYADLESGDAQLLERFCLAVGHLHAQVVRLRSLASRDPNWPRTFLEACDDLLPIGPDAVGETAVQRHLSNAFESLALFARLPTKGSASGALPTDLLRAFVAKHLRGLSSSHGDYLSGGVTLASLQPMRPIPFEILYILGMEEGGGFPGRADNSSLDLRLKRPLRGDVSTPERNNYLLLEALLSARRQVVISYVCRDLQRDRDLMPCAPVLQLKRFLSAHLLAEGAPFMEQRMPLKGSDPAYLTAPAPSAWADPLVNDNLLDRIIALRTTGAWPPSAAVPPTLEGPIAELTTERQTSASARPGFAMGGLQISTQELRRFLYDPLTATLARLYGVAASPSPLERLLAADDEPFSSIFPTDYRIVQETLEEWLDACWQDPQNSPPVTAIFQQRYDEAALRGEVPEGSFERLDRRRLAHLALSSAQTMAPLLDELTAAARRFARLHIGIGALSEAGSNDVETLSFPPVPLHLADSKNIETSEPVLLSGELTRIWMDGAGEWHHLLLTGGRGRAPAQPSHPILLPLLTFLAASCTDLLASAPLRLTFHCHLAAINGLRRFRYTVDRDDARQYLQQLAARFLDNHRRYWLPFKIVTGRGLRVQTLFDGEIDDPMRLRFLEQLIEAWDASGDYLSRLARPQFDLDCLDEARIRLGVFFSNEEV